MAWTAVTDFTDGDLVTAAAFNTILTDDLNWLKSEKPCCAIYNSANQSIADNTLTYLTYNSERYDTDDMHDTGVNTDRLVAPIAGHYLATAGVYFANNAVGNRWIGLFVYDGITNLEDANIFWIKKVASSGAQNLTIAGVFEMAAGDYVKVIVYQNSGGALNSNAYVGFPCATLTFLGALT